ncbi:unnamed protein product [Phytophthora fragariaefolia]|uniref:Unnamed protein product n=1 Tax=Phytophthora fragariaefolia TaxID=1490495 RepID=A0A9W6WVS2_9STRA|nr:unnamed protein product [Phytophthora fragariaefolia]
MSDSEGDLSADNLYLSDASSKGEDEIGTWACEGGSWHCYQPPTTTNGWDNAASRRKHRQPRILYTWFDSGVMAKMQYCINNNLKEASSVFMDERLKFLEVELWLCCYKITPDFFYDRRNIAEYPAGARVMGLARYRAILTALGKPSGLSDESTSTWTAPFSHNRDIELVAELIRRINRSIGFVDGVTLASLDDDLIRLRSSSVDNTGLAHVRNPKKGFGPVQHRVVSLVNGLVLGGHVATRGESTVDIVKLLQRSLCGASTESQIHLSGVLHALDRGYQSYAVNEHIVNIGGAIVGTHKRTHKFPFANAIIETKRIANSSYLRTGLSYWIGKVALCYMTLAYVGLGTWSYVSRPAHVSELSIDNPDFVRFENGVTQLTSAQRTPEWFILRKFRITGSVAVRVFHAVSRSQQQSEADGRLPSLISNNDVKTILELLGLPPRCTAVSNPVENQNGPKKVSAMALSRAELHEKSCEELKGLCRKYSLHVSGKKLS